MGNKNMTNPDGPPSVSQTMYILRLFGRSEGFAGFVPEWTEPPAGTKASDHAVTCLFEAGATKLGASEAIGFLSRSKPTSPRGEAYRRLRGMAHLFGGVIPRMSDIAPDEASASAPASAPTPTPAKPVAAPMGAVGMAEVLAAIAALRADIAALKG